MTAVANPPSFQQINRSAWNINGGQNLNSMNSDDVRGMFMPRKPMQRSNSSSSISSTSSASSTTTVATNGSQSNGAPSTNSDMSSWSSTASRKRPQPKAPWPPGKPENPVELGRMPAGRGPMNGHTINGSSLQQNPGQPQMAQQQSLGARPLGEPMPSGQPVLFLLSLNGTFERKTISVPFYPDSLRIGRQTNQKTIPTPANGFFDSKVLSRQHAEVWADRMGKIFIRDVKSSNGTFVNGSRLSAENRESEPHELQTQDHLELGIDIVSEDQKTVVHHKVAAKVEHAGFANPSSNVMEMNFGDLDPANGGAMLGPSQGGGMQQYRGRQGSNVSMASNGRMMPAGGIAGPQMNGAPGRGPFMLSSVTSDHIIKRLHNEMRSARLQSQDLGRTGQFIGALLSKEDIKDLDKPDVPELPKHMMNGNGLPFRADSKARFSDPPAPPPQQPLPEKPDVPSLKRAATERPKSHPTNSSPVRPDNMSQIIQLTEALNNAKKEIDTQTTRMKDLEEMLQREREARELAEDLARRLEDTAITKEANGVSNEGGSDLLEEAFEPPREGAEPVDVDMPDADAVADADDQSDVNQPDAAPVDKVEEVTVQLQTKIDSMMSDMNDLKQQMAAWKQRCEKAEAERDTDRQTLAEMVVKLRKEEEARQAAELAKSRSPSKGRGRSSSRASREQSEGPLEQANGVSKSHVEDPADRPTLSRANTITPLTASTGALMHKRALVDGVPYTSMLGVVLIGVGLMAYINGWQPPPRPAH
ncbi:hypothetical protein D7B24_001367 [Verticillium nonalfalfae]|uniref:FHA domain-containing protein n=1 Tax=Verticillium nonalfalfae TaxID=1051616 RepID=A0A3M9Y1H5_9PEZI|nr:uncharacterized protein D7B24_001367 [Verticillium nonalfalfae]RNJ53736.1 hypothetical protein D7B24_001367 [Verticillium nonalfalfae]